MSPLKAGAIALTLIIAVPIILGYGLASEESTVDVDVSENTGSLSDIVLNSTTPYYVTYSGVGNNYYLLRTVTSQGATESSLVNPSYVQTSATTYTYTPIYTTTSSTVTLDAATTVTYTDSAVNYGVGDSADVTLPDFAIAKLTYTLGGYPYFHFYYHYESIWYSVQITNGDAFYAMPSGSYYKLTGTNYSGEDFDILCDEFYITVNGDLTVLYNTYYTIPSSFPEVWNATVDGYLALGLYISGSWNYVAYTDATSIVVSYETVTVTHGTENDVYSDVSSIEFAQKLGDTVLTYYYQSSTVSTYADVSYGWQLPTSSGTYYDYWLNGFVNSYVRLMVHLEAGETLQISESRSDSTPALYLSSTSAGYVTAAIDGSTKNLGVYTDLMVEIESENGYGVVTVTGIAAWPSIGTVPEITYNSVYGTCSTFADDFSQFYITDVGTNSVEIRADSAQIVAGSFPSTEDYTLNLANLYPDCDKQSIIIDSVGVYGTYLTIGGTQFAVSDGVITVNGNSVNVKGMEIFFEENGSSYDITVNGYTWTASSATVLFEGEWSLTLHRNEITTESITQSSWVAGEFALDENGFVMAMLLVALAAFVGLGMTGGRSGAKVGILALICGGAVMVGLTLI